jgi:uncharacterized linocin/CFP29 family protein
VWQSYQKVVELPLGEEQATQMMQAAVQEVRRTVVGRRIISLYGPLGAGVESVPLEKIEEEGPAEIDLEGKPDSKPIRTHEQQTYIRVPIVYKDFLLHWRDVQWSKEMHAPLDLTNAVRAAHQVGDAEDNLIFNGNQELGLHGLLNYPGTLRVEKSDWKTAGAPARDVYAAISRLLEEKHHFPYALVTSVDMYEALIKPVKESPALELEQLGKLVEDGIMWSPQIPAGTAALVSTGVQNFDIAVAEDLQIAYLGPSDMNYRFRVYESLALRVKCPTAICVIQSGK